VGPPDFAGTAASGPVAVPIGGANVSPIVTVPVGGYLVTAQVGISVGTSTAATSVLCQITDGAGSAISGLGGIGLVAELQAVDVSPHTGNLDVSGIINGLAGAVALECQKVGDAPVAATDVYLNLVSVGNDVGS
jgi:hypothetical protein